MPDEKTKPKRRRVWLRRLIWFVGICVFLVLAAGGLGLKWAHMNRVELANRFLKKAGPFNASVGTVDFDRAGNIEVRDLEFAEPVSGTKLMTVPKLTGRVDWSTIRSGEIKDITLLQPEIMIEPKALATLLNQPGEVGTESSAPQMALHVGNIAIEKATVTLKQTDGSVAKLVATYHSKDLTLGANGQITTGDQELLIEEGQLTPKEESVSPIALKRLHMKGRIRDGFIELDHLTCDEPELRIKPELLAMFEPQADASAANPPARLTAAQIVQTTAAAAPFPIKGLRVGSIRVRGLGISTSGFLPGNSSGITLPDATGEVTYEANGVEWPFDGVPTTGTQKLHIDKLNLQAPDNGGHIRCEQADIIVALSGAGHPWRVEKCDLDGLDVNWTEAFHKWLIPAAEKKEDTPPPPAHSAPAPWSVILDDVQLTKAIIHIADPTLLDYTIDAKAALKVDDLLLDNGGWHSTKFQSLKLTDTLIQFPPADSGKPNKPFFELPQSELLICPDSWNKDMHVEKLALIRPLWRFREGNTPWLKADDENQRSVAGKQVEGAVGNKPAEIEAPWWTLLDFAELLIKDGTVDVLTEEAKPLDARATIDIVTEKLPDGVLHRLTLGGLEARLPTLSKDVPILRGAVVTCVARVPQVWSEKVLEEFSISGANVLAGKAMMEYLEEPAKPKTDEPKPEEEPKKPAPAAAPAGPQLSPWFCRKVEVEDCSVTLEHVVPGMNSLHFDLSFDAENTPLTPDDLADNVKPQRIEFSNLPIPAPHNPLEHVAELDSIFVDFTLHGLFHKEIDRIEIVGPTLLVGQPLFEYVDFYRKYVAQGAVPNAKEPRIAANDEELEFGVANTVMEGEQRASNAPWSVRTLQVHNGKLIVAPKGKPLKGFRTPFPFSFSTELKSGAMEADFEIPKGDYEWEDLKLRFEGLSGKVLFNLPMKTRDNNVTETFDVQHIRYDELRTGKAFLTVTYDKDGIYGKFGAEAYEGYINGGFDVFLDDSFNWDLWVNGDKVRTTEITQKLCPGYFFMDGRVEAKVIAQGNMHELYQADIKYKNLSPGRFSIAALNSLIKDLPKSWDGITKQMSTIGLETLRDFEYDKSDASFRFYGREGSGNLKFEGPAGSRNFIINVFDHRWKTDPVEATAKN